MGLRSEGVEGLGWTILLVRAFSRTVGVHALTIAPPQAVAVNEDDAAQDPPVINTWLAVALWKEGLQPDHLLGRHPERLLIDHAPRGAWVTQPYHDRWVLSLGAAAANEDQY